MLARAVGAVSLGRCSLDDKLPPESAEHLSLADEDELARFAEEVDRLPACLLGAVPTGPFSYTKLRMVTY